MERYNVTGMSCAACSAAVEKAVKSVPGVTACAVSLLTNSMGVEGTAAPAAVVAAVKKAGYGASPADGGSAAAPANALEDTQTPALLRRLVSSAVILLVLMYFSMGHMMLGLPLPAFFAGNHVAMGLAQLLLSAAVLIINNKFFLSGAKSLLHGAPNMDTLVAMGSGVSFLWSVYVLFLMTRAQTDGDAAAVDAYMMQFYFESAAMILTLITVGKLLEARAKGKTTNALKSLLALSPQTATVLRDGKEVRIPAAEVQTGDLFVLRPGESIPADGVVTKGESAVNEAALTGESIPVDKAPGSAVSAATINQSGFLTCRATRVGKDTTLSQIIKTVSDAAATKAPIAKIADRVSAVFVPAVLAVALVTLVVWLIAGRAFPYALERGVAVLVISCPCALGLATPVAITVGSGLGAKHGILFKTAQSLEQTGKVRTVVLDKTGTVTKGRPAVTDLFPAQGVTEEALLRLAAAAEKKSEHPLGAAIVAQAQAQGLTLPEASDFTALSGRGLSETVEGKPLLAGNKAYIVSQIAVPASVLEQADALAAAGKTPLFFAYGGAFLGLIAVADTIKDDSAAAISSLRRLGLHTVLLTGDNARTAAAIGREAGVDDVIAGVLPEEKALEIKKLQKNGPVMMVGDGINDAPALTVAEIGVAIGAGTDVAIDAADVVLMNSRLSDVAAAIRLSRRTILNIRENLFWAFFYNVIGIPLAAGLFIPLFGWELHPMFGAAAMSLSSFCVVTNALRLNLFHLHSAKHDRPLKAKKKRAPSAGPAAENRGDALTIAVEGMMCEHCEARVRAALEALPGVETAQASHKNGTVELTLSAPVARKQLKSAVKAAGYKMK